MSKLEKTLGAPREARATVRPCDEEVDGIWVRRWDVVKGKIDGIWTCVAQGFETRREARAEAKRINDADAEAEAEYERDRLSAEMEQSAMEQQCAKCDHNIASHHMSRLAESRIKDGICWMCGCEKFVPREA
jgi:hypothetical protein